MQERRDRSGAPCSEGRDSASTRPADGKLPERGSRVRLGRDRALEGSDAMMGVSDKEAWK